MHAEDRFREALEACRRLGARGLFVTRYRHQLPSRLPPSVLACDFAPFLGLFPLCAAVVHHGGIGTVAKALATGTPQLILPMAYDQLDNAARVKGLGAGDSLTSGRRRVARMAETLALVMDDRTRASCLQVAGRFRGDDALETAAKLVEGLAHRPCRAPNSIERSTQLDVGIE
jgi:rhamnosyltransferase subunit B